MAQGLPAKDLITQRLHTNSEIFNIRFHVPIMLNVINDFIFQIQGEVKFFETILVNYQSSSSLLIYLYKFFFLL